MSKLLASSCFGLGVIFLLGCQPLGPEEEEEDLPAVPIAADDAPRELAEQICGNLFACECAISAGYVDQADCVAQQTAQIEMNMGTVLDGGGSWNAECAGEMVKTWSKWDCNGVTTALHDASFDPKLCPVLKGNLGPGAECWNMGIVDPCREGLSCMGGSCIESPSVPVPVGGVCEIQWETLPCEAGSYCTWMANSEQRICVARPHLGDSCNPDDDVLCGLPSYDLICDPPTGTCIAAPTTGEPCFEQYLLCGPGNYCDGGKDFTCQPRRELGDGCGADAVCPVDASCIGNICTADAAAVCNLVNLL
jgi:hypothetical protein